MSILRPNLINRSINIISTIKNRLGSVRNKATNIETDDGPIKFTTSGASKWKAATSRSGIRVPRLWYEPYVVISSLTVFMVYFCILREESDIDLELDKSLYKRIDGLEEVQLANVYEYNTERGLDTKDIVERLEEIRAQK